MPADHRVSVVIASNRTGRFLNEAVAYVRAQTHPRHEIILVDDGFPGDHLREIAEMIGLRYIRQSASGVSIALKDDELVLRPLEQGEFIGVDEPLFGYRHHGSNVSDAKLAGWDASFQSLRLHLWGAPERGDYHASSLLVVNLRSFARNAGRATAPEALAAARRGSWDEAGSTAWWGMSRRGGRFLADLGEETAAWFGRRVRKSTSPRAEPGHR